MMLDTSGTKTAPSPYQIPCIRAFGTKRPRRQIAKDKKQLLVCAAAVTEQVESIVGKDKLTFPSIAEIADQTPLNLDQAPQVLEAAKTLPDAASQAAEEAKQILSVDITPEDGEGLLDGAQNIMSSIGKSFSDTANNLRGSLNGSAPKSAQPDSFRNASVGEISLGRDQASEPVEILSSQSTSPAVDPIGQGATVSSNSGSASDAIESARSIADQANSSVESAARATSSSQGLTENANVSGDSLANSISQTTDNATSGIDGALNSLDSFTDYVWKVLMGGPAGNFGKAITKQLSDFEAGISDAADGASTNFESLRGSATGLAEDLSTQALQSANETLYTLPAPVRETIQAVLKPITQALEIPPVRNTAILFAVGYPAYLWFTARFGGFSGRLAPLAARKVLETEDALLLDVRPDNSRDIAGIPELRGGARNKGVALPLLRVKQKTGTQVVRAKANVLSFQVAALLVQGLSKVTRSSKIIVLSDSETQAVKLARAIVDETTLPAYILKDGLTGWVSAGLPLSDESDYDSGPIAEFSGVVEGRILPFLRDPFTAIGAIFLSLGISAAIIDEHKTLQFIGALGLTFTIGTIPIRYNSLKEATDDILGPFVKISNAVTRLIPQSSKQAAVNGGSTSASTAQSTLTEVSKPTALSKTEEQYDDGYGDILSEDTGTQVLKPQSTGGTKEKSASVAISEPAPSEFKGKSSKA